MEAQCAACHIPADLYGALAIHEITNGEIGLRPAYIQMGILLHQLTIMARQGRIDMVDMKPFMEVYSETWQTLNSLLSRVV